MVTISRGKFSLQLKFSISYTLIIVLVLVFMNSYPLLASENLVFKSKENEMTSVLKAVESNLSDLVVLNEESVYQAMNTMESTGVSRILITDTAGRILYDTRESGGATGMYAFYTEIVQALKGYDVFYCKYDTDAFFSRIASPIIYHNQTIGAIYAYEYDTEQADLLMSLQNNLLRISIIVLLFVIMISLIMAAVLSNRVNSVLTAIEKVREGNYNHRAEVKGKDELTQIAEEFNSLANRLQTTEESRRRFVSDASHELKTPLAGIRLLTDSILQTEDMPPEMTQEFVNDIGQEAERLTRITENLLRLTRLDSGAIVQAYPVELMPVLRRVERMLQIVAQEKKITLSLEGTERAAVYATEDDMHQVFYNLVENGIKYASGENGFVKTNVSIQNDHVIILVEDNGIGIPEEDIEHIFERFYRVDKMRSRAIGGTGLGLSIVRDTVESRGGHIHAEQREEGGSVFIVDLPLWKEDEV